MQETNFRLWYSIKTPFNDNKSRYSRKFYKEVAYFNTKDDPPRYPTFSHTIAAQKDDYKSNRRFATRIAKRENRRRRENRAERHQRVSVRWRRGSVTHDARGTSSSRAGIYIYLWNDRRDQAALNRQSMWNLNVEARLEGREEATKGEIGIRIH